MSDETLRRLIKGEVMDKPSELCAPGLRDWDAPVRFDEGSGVRELLCPACDSNFIHHDRVEVFDRDEDKEKGLHVSVDAGRATVDDSLEGNPSGRRHGLTIHFWCEICGARSDLTFAQHKGCTHARFQIVRRLRVR